MKIYKSKIPMMADDIANKLIAANAVEVTPEQKSEFLLDLQAVIQSYMDTDRRIHEEAQQIISTRGLDFSSFGRVKREVAKKYNFAIGDESMNWIIDQIIEMLFHTSHVEEVWAENHEIRVLIREALQKYALIDEALDVEVRKRIKNLNEGSLAWDVKYKQVLEEIRLTKGLR